MRIGIDLGGTKIEVIALGAGGTERFRLRVDAPRDHYPETVRAILGLVQAAETATGEPGTIGLGIPGTISPATGVVKNANSTWINGHPLHKDLERALGRPVRIANDANCFALSEATDGAGTGANIVFGVIIGTGVGGGVVVDGRVLVGANAIAGEWGHNSLPWPDAAERPGPSCYCGKAGCIETFLSGRGLLASYDGTDAATAHAVADAAARGERHACDALALYASRLARALAAVINLLDPNIIVLGGGLSNIELLYERVPNTWGRWVFSDRVATRLTRARHGDSSGVRGAAWLWPEEAGSGSS
jgi:fructokinase